MAASLPSGHQDIDLGHGDFLAHRGQVQVDGGAHQRAVPQVLLDLPQVDAGFEQMFVAGGGDRSRNPHPPRSGLLEPSDAREAAFASGLMVNTWAARVIRVVRR